MTRDQFLTCQVNGLRKLTRLWSSRCVRWKRTFLWKLLTIKHYWQNEIRRGRKKWAATLVNIRTCGMPAGPLIFRSTYRKLWDRSRTEFLCLFPNFSSLNLRETILEVLLLVDSHPKRTIRIKKVETRDRLSSKLLNIMMLLMKIMHLQCSNIFQARIKYKSVS